LMVVPDMALLSLLANVSGISLGQDRKC
jgi:hypothetical protein